MAAAGWEPQRIVNIPGVDSSLCLQQLSQPTSWWLHRRCPCSTSQPNLQHGNHHLSHVLVAHLGVGLRQAAASRPQGRLGAGHLVHLVPQVLHRGTADHSNTKLAAGHFSFRCRILKRILEYAL